jgi:hypothetical protein
MTQEQSIDLLAISHKYQVPAAVKKAKDTLLASGMSPALQLNLGRRFGFSDWVENAAKAIVHIPLLSLSSQDHRLIGLESIVILNEMHMKLSHHRARTCLMLPVLLASHPLGCRHQVKCLAHWKDVCLLLSRQILRPGVSVTDTELLEILETQEAVREVMEGMSAECVQQVKVKCREALVGKDVWLVQSVINQLSQ